MAVVPARFARIILCFAGLFCQRTWQHAQLLLMGAVLVPGARTVASVLGLADDVHFVNFHRVLSRAAWSPRTAARVLLGLLVRTFVPEGPIVLGIDDTIERRRGARIAAKGLYRDPVRSSHSHFVKASGLCWLSVMLLVRVVSLRDVAGATVDEALDSSAWAAMALVRAARAEAAQRKSCRQAEEG
jgi:hypothetical protein